MIISEIKDYLINFIDSVGYLGVFIAMTIESCLIPLPSEITMGLAGALSAQGSMNIHLACLVGATGNLVGSWGAYWIGLKVKETAILKFLRRWGKFILVSEHEYLKTKDWLKRKGNAVSFFSRLLPGVRTVVSLPAGVAKIDFLRFSIFTFAGSLMWSYVLAFAGYKLGQNWEDMEKYFNKFQIVIVAGCVLIIVLYVLKKTGFLGKIFKKKSH